MTSSFLPSSLCVSFFLHLYLALALALILPLWYLSWFPLYQIRALCLSLSKKQTISKSIETPREGRPETFSIASPTQPESGEATLGETPGEARESVSPLPQNVNVGMRGKRRGLKQRRESAAFYELLQPDEGSREFSREVDGEHTDHELEDARASPKTLDEEIAI